ncbi:hypothetical protein M5K25_008350 [Dendrobium thyrsiflorum]|uniref:R3H domain-containing protein n=1 Tax=Dendrobium thyrsiflorum TaxID=117978 RepID=A0ABD0VF59_DENTH
MTTTQFAMVEELASLIKDNLHCKHLVLSTEEAFISFLQNDSRPEVVLELQPMSPYQRLLLHRLADIYGFAHVSVGEGEERHLLLERCPETAIPSILVSDILWEFDEYQSPTAANLILRRKDSPEIKDNKAIPSATPLEVREAAYAAARERIFSLHEANEREVVPPKSRKVPVVAQRMIAHALGQKASYLHKCEGNDKYEVSNVCSSKDAKETNEHSEIRKPVPYQKKGGKFPAKNSGYDCSSEPKGNKPNGLAAHRKAASTEFLERERIGAAKRIFAQALGTASSNIRHDINVRTNGSKQAPDHQ